MITTNIVYRICAYRDPIENSGPTYNLKYSFFVSLEEILFDELHLSKHLFILVIRYLIRGTICGVTIFNIIYKRIVLPTSAYHPGSKSEYSPVKNGKSGILS